ncbi:MAG: hypothetical protein N3A62_09325 [Thermodesulfovibrionales bacterium]|nr:hypothetical protein [Thermodesulfovibrionales bacterium]
MIDTLQIYEELKEDISEVAAKKIASSIGKVYTELANMVTKTEFNELKEIVRELAEAQKRTEEKVEELAEAQKRTEQKVEELAEAQKATQKELRELIGEHKKTRQQVGSLSHTVGYVLEDRAYIGLPKLLKRDFDIEIIKPIRRDYVEISPNRFVEINIIAEARINNKDGWILGDCKTQIKKADVDSFLENIKKLDYVLKGERLLVMVTFQTSPAVRRYIQDKGIKLYFSYEMPFIY